MSDALILGLFTPIMIAISTWVTIWLNARIAAKIASKVDANCRKLEVVEEKLDESHKQMNGNLDKLIKSTADLAVAHEKARAKK